MASQLWGCMANAWLNASAKIKQTVRNLEFMKRDFFQHQAYFT